jgi:hypothetical protein
MTDQVLTDERRGELAALLNDEQRLNVEYPKVADYLDTALRLPGTGDADVDGAFDLRLVHYMVGGSVDTVNPYWDIVAPAIGEQDGRRVVNGRRPDGSPRLAYAQMLLQATYAYAVPSSETIEWVSDFCSGRPLLELGAGRGYWAAQLARAGLPVTAYDSEPPDAVENMSFPRAAGQRDVWHPVSTVGELAEPIAKHPDSVLFLCWPPGWGNTMAAEALAQFGATGGERLIFVGQPRGGMNATDAFFDLLADEWRLESEDARHVSWWNLPDVAQGWVRR